MQPSDEDAQALKTAAEALRLGEQRRRQRRRRALLAAAIVLSFLASWWGYVAFLAGKDIAPRFDLVLKTGGDGLVSGQAQPAFDAITRAEHEGGDPVTLLAQIDEFLRE